MASMRQTPHPRERVHVRETYSPCYVCLRVVIVHRICEHLGSGHFGTVSKGLWCERGKAKEVAVKTLQAEASEDERVKFLQEAAIMGQFHHPNVLSILGIITCEEPVRNLQCNATETCHAV